MSRFWAFFKMLPSNIFCFIAFLLLLPWAKKVELRRERVSYVYIVQKDKSPVFLITRKTSGCPTIAGVTLGSFIFIDELFTDNKVLLHHETIHVEQQERWSFCYPFMYIYYSWKAAREGKDKYMDNKFEVEAYARQGEDEV